ncbi:MAG: Lrp/AsnC ligand binding domain-containing protein [Candidatus Thermoplasmatota archaeon]|nr:Lrp/AsnC ligand binding domain-containing protein [Candidatus Thermoplasmatota archaeon]
MLRNKLQINPTEIYLKKQYEPIQAYIMTNVYPGMYTKALDEIKKINHIEKISIVTGNYDIVVKVNVKNLEQLHKITSRLHKVIGVEKTNTQIIEKECQLFSQ